MSRTEIDFYMGQEVYGGRISTSVANAVGRFFHEYPPGSNRGKRITHAVVTPPNKKKYTLNREQLLFYAATEGVSLSSSADFMSFFA